MSELLDEYEQHHRDRGNTEKQAGQVRRRCEMVFEGCGFVQLTDLDGTAAERWLADRRTLAKADGGISAQTSNHYSTALKSFGNWLVKARRADANPFRHLARVNVEVDIRHQRRPLSADEFARLLAAAHSGDEFRGLPGADRAMLYLVAGMTGLRASELASLTPTSFSLLADPPVVVVEAAYSKHRRRDEVPLHLDLVVELRAWIAGKAAGEPLWPGKWAKHNEAVDLIKRDLEAARASWIEQAGTAEEKKASEDSDFLAYRDRDGRVSDFHSLRHRFVTELVNAGVAPKDAKELARHSTITLTMDRYAHVGIRDTAAALGKLNVPTLTRPGTERAVLKATGTEDGCGAGAATGAAEGDNRRVESGTGEEKDEAESGEGDSPECLNSQGIEGDRGEVGAGEQSTPSRSRTCNLRFRRPMLYPVELWVPM